MTLTSKPKAYSFQAKLPAYPKRDWTSLSLLFVNIGIVSVLRIVRRITNKNLKEHLPYFAWLSFNVEILARDYSGFDSKKKKKSKFLFLLM